MEQVKLNNPEVEKNHITVIVPTHNRLDLTARCLHALYQNTQVPFDLVVVDDSTDMTPQYIAALARERGNIKFIHSDTPYKSGNQLFNIGLANTATDLMATVMNSVTVEPEWELGTIAFLHDSPKVGVVGIKCLFPNGQIESAGIRMNGHVPTDIGRNLPGHRLSTMYPCEAVQWALAIVRKEAAINNLEEDIFFGFRGWDDIDNCFVLRKHGWHVFYCGLGAGYHEPRATRGTALEDMESHKQNHANAIIFWKRWGYWNQYLASMKQQPVMNRAARRKLEKVVENVPNNVNFQRQKTTTLRK